MAIPMVTPRIKTNQNPALEQFKEGFGRALRCNSWGRR